MNVNDLQIKTLISAKDGHMYNIENSNKIFYFKLSIV